MKLHFWQVFKVFPSSKIDFWPFLKLQKMDFGQKKFFFSWNWFIWFHQFFWPGHFFLIFWPTMQLFFPRIYCTIWPLGNDSHFRVYNFNFWVIVDDVDLLTLIASNFKFFFVRAGNLPTSEPTTSWALLLVFLPFCGWKCALKFRKRPDV